MLSGFHLRRHTKEQSYYIAFMPWSGGKTSFWYLRRMTKRKRKLGMCSWIVHFSQSKLHHEFMTNATTHLWTSTAFAITGNIKDSSAKSWSTYQWISTYVSSKKFASSSTRQKQNTVTGGSNPKTTIKRAMEMQGWKRKTAFSEADGCQDAWNWGSRSPCCPPAVKLTWCSNGNAELWFTALFAGSPCANH